MKLLPLEQLFQLAELMLSPQPTRPRQSAAIADPTVFMDFPRWQSIMTKKRVASMTSSANCCACSGQEAPPPSVAPHSFVESVLLQQP